MCGKLTDSSGLVEFLRYRETSLPQGYSTRLLRPNDLAVLASFGRAIVAGLANPDHYRIEVEPPAFAAKHIDGAGVIIGIFHHGILVGYGALGLPRATDKNRGRDYSMRADQLPFVAHMASAMVSPAARRLKLHRWLIETRLQFARHLGRTHIFSTVSPANSSSWSNLAAFAIYPRKLIDTGLGYDARRFVLYRDLNETIQLAADSARLLPLHQLVAAWDGLPAQRIVWARLMIGERKFALVGSVLA